MRAGGLQDLAAGEYRIILGSELAYNLGAHIGDHVTMVTPQANYSPAGVLPRLRRFLTGTGLLGLAGAVALAGFVAAIAI